MHFSILIYSHVTKLWKEVCYIFNAQQKHPSFPMSWQNWLSLLCIENIRLIQFLLFLWMHSLLSFFYCFVCIPYCHSFSTLNAFTIVILLVLCMHSLLSFFQFFVCIPYCHSFISLYAFPIVFSALILLNYPL